jgi:hypothetical protein
VPKNIIIGGKRITTMTKTARDDYEIIRDFGLTQPEFQYYTYQEDVDRILFEGGMYVFKMHTEYQCDTSNIKVVGKVINELKKKNFWIATGDDIQKWYAEKSNVQIRTDQRGPKRIALTISNPGTFTVNNLVIQLEINAPASNIVLSTEIIGTKKATFDYDKDSKVVYVYINDMKPNESRTYYLDYNRPNS